MKPEDQKIIDELKNKIDSLNYKILKLENKPVEKFDSLKTEKSMKILIAHIGLPIFTAVPTYTGFQGETIFVDDGSSIRRIYTYLNGTWRYANLT